MVVTDSSDRGKRQRPKQMTRKNSGEAGEDRGQTEEPKCQRISAATTLLGLEQSPGRSMNEDDIQDQDRHGNAMKSPEITIAAATKHENRCGPA
jgi:hypothetical protein